MTSGLPITDIIYNPDEYFMEHIVYHGDTEGFQDIFFLADAYGYLFLNLNENADEAGVFFVQCT